MQYVVGLLLAFLTIESLMLVLWPQQVRQMIHDASPSVLRVAGAIELAIVVVVVLILLNPF